jgi:LysM repeat protein
MTGEAGQNQIAISTLLGGLMSSTTFTPNYSTYTPFYNQTKTANTADSTNHDWDGDPTTVVKAESDAAGTATFNDFKGRDPDLLAVGEQIKLDESGKTHEVKAGETLSSIAGTEYDVETLMKLNGFDQSLTGQRSDGDYFDRNAAALLVMDTSSLQVPTSPTSPTSETEVEDADKDKDKDTVDEAPADTEATTTDSGTPAAV